MNRILATSLFLVAALAPLLASALPAKLSADPPSASASWHQEAGNAQHTGYTPEDVPQPWSFKWQWNGSCYDPPGSDCRPGDPELGYSFAAPPRSHIVEGDGRLYLPAGSNGVWAINESDGKTAWHNEAISSTVTAAFDPGSNALFVAASDGVLYKLDSSDGSAVASFRADSGLNLAPIIVAGRVFVVSSDGTLYAVDKLTMELVWSYSAASPGQTPAAHSEVYGVLVFATEDLYVHAVSDLDGSLVWRVKPTVNENDGTTYPGGDGGTYLRYNYEHGWPVIAEDHGVVFVRLHLRGHDMWYVPGPANWYPTSNDEIRSFLTNHPNLQTLFALSLSDGSAAFIPAVGWGFIDSPEVITNGGTLGPLPVVRRVDGHEVVYMIWRNGQKCEAGDCSDPRWDAVMGEMVLDDSTVPGYEAGDLRFVRFSFLATDEMGKLSMAGDTLFHSHWLASYASRITDRANSRGDSYGNPILAEKQPAIANRLSNEPKWVVYQPTIDHFSEFHTSAHRDGRTFKNAFWVFFNDFDPPYVGCGTPNCSAGYGDGYRARYTIVHDGTIYYETNGGTIFAVQTAGSTQQGLRGVCLPIVRNGDGQQ